MNDISKKIVRLRHKKGISQELLAENSGLSLRTIQRIEKGSTTPTGDSIKKIAIAFNVTLDELIDLELIENNDYLRSLNLSALIFLFFPVLGVILPTILWLLKKGQIKNLNKTGRSLINFQITWNLMLFSGIGFMVISTKTKLLSIGFGPISLFVVLMYLFNLISILINSWRASRGKKVTYLLSIRFI